MRYKRIISLFSVLVLLFTQNSLAAFSISGSYSKSGTGDEPKTITLDDNFAEALKVIDKVYNKDVDAEIDFSSVELKGLQDNDDVRLSASAKFDSPDVGNDKTVTVFDFKLEGENENEYVLKLQDENLTVNLSGNITPRPVHIIPGNMGKIYKDKIDVPYLFSEWGFEEADVIKDDTVNVFGNLYIVKDGENYVYSVDDINTDNSNYTVVLKEGAVPDIYESEKVKIDEKVIVESNVNENYVLKYFNFGIVSNSSIKLLVTVDSEPEVENMKIKLLENDNLIGDTVEIEGNDYNVVTDENNKEWYRYVAELTVDVPENEKGVTLSNAVCEVEIGDNSVKQPLEFKLQDSEKTSKNIIIDKAIPTFDEKNQINVEYNNSNKRLNVTGSVIDDFSGIASVEYKWDKENNKYISYKPESSDSSKNNSKENDKISKLDSLDLNITTKYRDLEKTENGRHILYLKITDNAGNTTETKGYFCGDDEGMDTKSPYIEKIELKSKSDKLINQIITILTFGNYSKQDMELIITAKDKSESKKVGGVKSVVLMDGETQLDNIKPEKEKNGDYKFNINEEKEIENFNIKLTDNFGNTQTVSVKDALKDYTSTDSDNLANWDKLESDKWILDKNSPNISVNYGSHEEYKDVKYYNKNGGTIKITVTDNYALKDVSVKEITDDGSQKIIVNESYNVQVETTDTPDSNIYKVKKEYTYEINTAKLETGAYTYKVVAHDWANNKETTADFSFYVEHEEPMGSLEIVSPKTVTDNNVLWVNARDDNGNIQPIKLRLKPHSNGSELNHFVFNVNSEIFEFNSDSIKYDENKNEYVELEIDPNKIFSQNNSYTINYTITTAANNSGFGTFDFKIDTEAPTINKLKVKNKNTVLESILNVLSFGVFCNDALILNADVADGKNDIGIDYVTIKYDGIDEPQRMNLENYGYEIELPKETNVFQSNIVITAYDKAGNHKTVSPQIANTEKEDDVSDKCFVMLENIAPEVSITLEQGDGVERSDNQIWYMSNKTFTVNVSDENSGIREIIVKVNNKPLTADSEEKSILNIEETSSENDRINEPVEYKFSTEQLAEKIEANDDGSYIIEVYAVDNAGNVSNTAVKKYYIDIVKPQIVNFNFKPATEDGIDVITKEELSEYVEELEYYYYFKKDFDVIINAEDQKYSSGFYKTEFRFVSYENKEIVNEETHEVIMDGSEASITVSAGFKGMIYARVYDKTGNCSAELTPKAFVIDDTAPEINIEKLPDNKSKTDDKGNKLYTDTIKFKVTVTDTKSGLRDVSYSQSSDLNSYSPVVTNIDNNVDIDDNTTLTNGWKIEQTDFNLITVISKTFTFDKDDKNIYMTFSAADRSKNESGFKTTEKFTIDKTSPKVEKFGFEPSTVDDISQTDEFIEELEYGYYFKESFDLIAYVDDNIPSSGLDKTVFRMVQYITEEDSDSENSAEDDTENDTELDTDINTEKSKPISGNTDSSNQDNEDEEESKFPKTVETTYVAEVVNKKSVCRVPKGFKGQIYVQVFDRASNSSKEVTSKAFVADDKAPDIIIEPLPDNKSKTDDMGNKLYTDKVQFKVTISDKQSGLRQIVFSKKSDLDPFDDVVTKTENSDTDTDDTDTDSNDKKSDSKKNNKNSTDSDNEDTETDETSYLENEWEIVEKDANLITEVSRIFTFDKDDKNIVMTFSAADNSKNDTGSKKSEKFTIDTTAPFIVKYNFEPATTDGISEVSDFIEELEYGFYFKRDFNAIVTSEDKSPTSGLDKVAFRIVSYDNGELDSEDIQEISVEDKKAVYLVPAGFKGQIYAQVYDRAANHSDEETPQAFVSDEDAPVIKIDPLPNNNSKTDMNGNKLYTGTIDFKVTITDEKAGLRELVYSKSSEKNTSDNVVTSINNTQGYNENVSLENGWEVNKTDKNLITEVSQVFSFSEDDNNISMSFSATDRSHNTSQTESTEIFTIDKTAPSVVISNSQEPVNGKYYKDRTTYTITVTERNFDEKLMYSEIENTFTNNMPSVKFAATGENVYTAVIVFEEGDYKFNFTGEDRGGHKTEIRTDKSDYSMSSFSAEFNVDATAPELETNFNSFGDLNNSEIYFNKAQTIEFKVKEHNFDEYDMAVKVESKAPGTSHSNNDDGWYEIGYSSEWDSESDENRINKDLHTLNIVLEEDAVYRISVAPVDRAGNKIEKSQSPIFEIDTVKPELYSRNEQYASDKGFVESPYYEVYDEKKKDEPAPVVSFDDLNFYRIEVQAVVYLPEYKNGMEYGDVLPDKLSDELSKPVNSKEFSLPNFEKDGVYAMTYVAVDKAGNRSTPINDTYFRMVNTDVLAYIYNSSKKDHTGYYSLMSEDGKAISKKAANFQDLDIFVIKLQKDDSAGVIVLREDDKQYLPNDYLKVENENISETAVLTKTRLPSSYFSETFKDDNLDTRMYLSVSIHDNAYLDLASIHIDNEPPSADLPEGFVNWHNYMFAKEVTIELSNITETLNDEWCKVYECPRGQERTAIPFTYSKEKKSLTFVLGKGSHNIDITLTDEAGNEWNIDRVKYLRVGNFRLYLVTATVLVLIISIVTFKLVKRKKGK